MTEIKIGLPKKAKDDLFYFYTGKFRKRLQKNPNKYVKKVFQGVGFVSKEKIYLYGFNNNFRLWINILIHENYHILLDLFNIKDDYHHKIIKKLGVPYNSL